MRGDATSTHIHVLDGPALRALSTELNSSKYAIDAHNRSIREIGNLSELPTLYSLDVSFNQITSLRNVSTAKELRELKIYNNKLTNTCGLKANSNLEGLQMNTNQIEEISGDFFALGKLKNVWLNSNRVKKVQNLHGCRHMVHLDLGRNKLQGIASEGLDALITLEYLNLAGNQLTSIGNFSHLTNLEELDVSDNKLTTVQGTMPTNLVILRVNANQISNFHGWLAPLEKLNELYARDNIITDLEALPMICPQLESIDLQSNQIEKISDILALAKCKALQDIWLHGNPCCLLSSYFVDVMTAFPSLKTFDAFTDTQLHICREKLKIGVIAQDELPHSSDSSTPLYHSGSVASRLNSARVRTPIRMPATPEISPVFFTPSTRFGNLNKVMSTDELSKAQEEVHCQLRKLKLLLTSVDGKPDVALSADSSFMTEQLKRVEPVQQRTSVHANLKPAAIEVKENASTTNAKTRIHAAGKATKTTSITSSPVAFGSGATKSNRVPKFVPRARTVQALLIRRSCVDAGTDPLESLMRFRELDDRDLPTSGCEMETQTSMLPAPVLSVSKSGSLSGVGRILTEAKEQYEMKGERYTLVKEEVEKRMFWLEPQQDGDLIEAEMKQFLTRHALATSDDNQNTVEDQDDEDTKAATLRSTSPKLPVKHINAAALRNPPTLLARKGYRSFRMPSRPSSSKGTGVKK